MATSGSINARDGGQDSPFEAHLPSILIVDDSHDSADTLGSLFAAHGYKNHVVYEWAAALDAAKAHLPDVILLDLGMLEMDGVHAARFFREDEQDHPRVNVSSLLNLLLQASPFFVGWLRKVRLKFRVYFKTHD